MSLQYISLNKWKTINLRHISVTCTAWKVSLFRVILVRIFLHSDWIRSRITPNSDTFYTVLNWSLNSRALQKHIFRFEEDIHSFFKNISDNLRKYQGPEAILWKDCVFLWKDCVFQVKVAMLKTISDANVKI